MLLVQNWVMMMMVYLCEKKIMLLWWWWMLVVSHWSQRHKTLHQQGKKKKRRLEPKPYLIPINNNSTNGFLTNRRFWCHQLPSSFTSHSLECNRWWMTMWDGSCKRLAVDDSTSEKKALVSCWLEQVCSFFWWWGSASSARESKKNAWRKKIPSSIFPHPETSSPLQRSTTSLGVHACSSTPHTKEH